MHSECIEFDNISQQVSIFGIHDSHIRTIEKAFAVTIKARDSRVEITGENADFVRASADTFRTLKKMYDGGEIISDLIVSQALEVVRGGEIEDTVSAMKNVIAVTHRGKPVKCRTLGQKNYIKALRENTVTICIGPAGTGKTYLGIGIAVAALKSKEISRIILTRPAVEAGEKLGFLPGDLQSKVDPYLRPLYDALYDFLGEEQVQRHLENRVIEVAPLAYMRGRTLNDAYVVVDESQNATLDTLKMVLTRLGENSKMILTGDITQVDLPAERNSGLRKVADMLKNVDDIAVINLTNRDVVRHKLVKDIVKAFEKYEKKQMDKQPKGYAGRSSNKKER